MGSAILIGVGIAACGATTDTDFEHTDATGGNGNNSGGTSNAGGSSGNASGNSGGSSASSGGTSAGGSVGGTMGTGAVSSTASVTATITTTNETTTSSTSTTGSTPGLCGLPLEAGPCEAYFHVWGFDPEVGRCVEFTYGGCEGNENRFEKLDDCIDTCDPGGGTRCKTNSECAINHGCCGYCGVTVDNVEPINIQYGDWTSTECQLVDCALCEPMDGVENFGARCESGQCTLYDVRESELAECGVDSDCRLRAGLGCCESCDGNYPVAISADNDELLRALCDDETVACPACAPIIPEHLTAVCGDNGQCQVVSLER